MPATSLSLLEPAEAVTVMMTETEAREKTDVAKLQITQIETMVGVSRRLVFELYQKEAWRALGFANFVAYAKKEFSISKTHSYRLVDGARVEALLGNSTLSLSQSEVGELSRLPDEQVAFVWQQANGSGKRPKPAELKNWVNIALGIRPKKKRKPKAAGAAAPKPESVQIILKPSLGTSEAKWKPKAAEGITLICHVNRETDLNTLIQGIDAEKIATQIEEAIATLYAEEGKPETGNLKLEETYAATLPLATHSDY